MHTLDTNLLAEEVLELTELLRHLDDWESLREALARQGVPISASFLAGFFEDEAGHEFGAVVTPDGTAYSFTRSSADGARGFVEWERALQPESLLDMHAAIMQAVRMENEAPATQERR